MYHSQQECSLQTKKLLLFGQKTAIFKKVMFSFLSAEDKNFYRHPGIDLFGIARALIQNVLHAGSGKRLVGASTITQQVAKNFLLTNEVSINRKIREAILAIRIERTLSKERILELYLNEIFLGQRSYGVAAAAMNYFNKALSDLDLSEVAFLAGLPKAPNSYHPNRNPSAAAVRMNYVLRRMLEDGYIDSEQLWVASGTPIELRGRDRGEVVNAPFFAEEVLVHNKRYLPSGDAYTHYANSLLAHNRGGGGSDTPPPPPVECHPA